MFPGEEAAKPGAGLPNTGWARVGVGEEKTDAGVEENEKGEFDGAVDELKTTGAELFGAEDVADAPKENPVAGDEPKIEDEGACKLEPKALEGAVLELTELIAEDEAEELPPNLNTLEAPLLKELAALEIEAEAGALNPKLKTEGAAPPVDPPALVEEEELLKKLVVTVAEPEELAPKLKPEAEAPPVDPIALVEEEEELKPKLNTLGVVKLLELPALPSETGEGFALNKLDVGPLLETTAPVSDDEAEELRPKDMIGLKP